MTSHKEFLSLGSASELETQVIISMELNFIDKEKSERLQHLIFEIIKMTSSLINTMKTRDENFHN